MGFQINRDAGKMRLYSRDNQRLYINRDERRAFCNALFGVPRDMQLYGMLLLYSGCRMSEGRYLRWEDVQISEGLVSVRTLKRRGDNHIREIPMPDAFLSAFEAHHRLRASDEDTWVFSLGSDPPPRITCYRWIKAVMQQVQIGGRKASPKGLRHGFGVNGYLNHVGLHMLQKWMGHASMETTAIYASVVGKDEREAARWMW